MASQLCKEKQCAAGKLHQLITITLSKATIHNIYKMLSRRVVINYSISCFEKLEILASGKSLIAV